MNSPASCTTTMRSSIFFYNDITELDEEQRDEITFEFWLEEMISFTESDDTSTGSTRQRRPKCGTGQSDRAMSVLAHEPGELRCACSSMAPCTERRMRNL